MFAKPFILSVLASLLLEQSLWAEARHDDFLLPFTNSKKTVSYIDIAGLLGGYYQDASMFGSSMDKLKTEIQIKMQKKDSLSLEQLTTIRLDSMAILRNSAESHDIANCYFAINTIRLAAEASLSHQLDPVEKIQNTHLILVTRYILGIETAVVLGRLNQLRGKFPADLRFAQKLIKSYIFSRANITRKDGHKQLRISIPKATGMRKAALLKALLLTTKAEEHTLQNKIAYDLIALTKKDPLALANALTIISQKTNANFLLGILKLLPLSTIKDTHPNLGLAIDERLLHSKRATVDHQLNFYKHAAKITKAPALKGGIDIRVIQILKNNSRHAAFSKHISSVIKSYEKMPKDSGQSLYLNKIRSIYKNQIKTIFTKIDKSDIPHIPMLTRFLHIMKNSKKMQREYLPKLAGLYKLSGQDKKSVATYIYLHTHYPKQQHWLSKAFALQKNIVKFEPLKLYSEKKSSYNTKLLEKLTIKLSKSQPKTHAVQLAILKITNNKPDAGIKLLLKISADTPNKNLQTKLISSAAFHSKRFAIWPLLSQATQQARINRIEKLLGPKKESVTSLRTLALQKIISSQLAAGKSKQAIASMKTLLNTTRDTPEQRDLQYKSLIKTQTKSSDSNGAIKTIKAYVKEQPQGKILEPLLITGLELTKNKKHDKVFFLRSLLKNPSNDRDSRSKHLYQLGLTYLALKDYAKSIDAFKSLVLSKTTITSIKMESAYNTMVLNRKYGDTSESTRIYREMIKLKPRSLGKHKKLTAILTDYAIEKKFINQFSYLDTGLMAASRSDPMILNRIGLLRYLEGVIMASKIIAKPLNTKVGFYKNAKNTLIQYQMMTKVFSRTCQIKNIYCRLGNAKLKKYGLQLAKKLEKVTPVTFASKADEKAIMLLKLEVQSTLGALKNKKVNLVSN